MATTRLLQRLTMAMDTIAFEDITLRVSTGQVWRSFFYI